MKEFKNDMRDNEKEAYAQADMIREQNKKMMEIDEKLHNIDLEVEKGKEYERGLNRGMFGFIPDFFRSIFHKPKTYKNEKIEDPLEIKRKEEMKKKKEEKSNKNSKGELNVQKVENKQDFDDLMNEIKQMNKGAQELRNEAYKSNKLAEDLHKHIEYTNKGVNEISTKAEKISKK